MSQQGRLHGLDAVGKECRATGVASVRLANEIGAAVSNVPLLTLPGPDVEKLTLVPEAHGQRTVYRMRGTCRLANRAICTAGQVDRDVDATGDRGTGDLGRDRHEAPH